MKIATYNLNSINARIENLTAWLKTANPDILLAQEIKSTSDNFPFFELKTAGYNAEIAGQKSYNGVAIISRHKIKLIHSSLPGFGDENARYIEADVEVGGTTYRIASIYLPNGNPPPDNLDDDTKFKYKLAWMDAFYAHAKELVKLPHPVILGGDFNTILTDNDVYNPKAYLKNALFRPEVRQRLVAFSHLGFYDAFRALHPEDNRPDSKLNFPGLRTIDPEKQFRVRSNGYTFWDYMANAFAVDHGMRIDYLFMSAPAVDKLVSCYVDKSPRKSEKPSDHTTLIAELKV